MTNYPQENIKPYNDDEKKSVQVEKMFDNIAPAYDQLNHALSWNIDKSWRRKAINWLKPFHPQRMMDVATGTGDFAIQACRILQPEELIGTDISEGMMNVGREKVKAAGLESRISFAKEDCTALTFPDKRFDAITVAFGVRNFEDLDKGLREIHRVLDDNGKLVILELSEPDWFPMKQLYAIYSKVVIPTLGKLLSKDQSAYTYLPQSIKAFPQGEIMTDIIRKAGFSQVNFKRLTLGICTFSNKITKSKSFMKKYGLIGYPLGHSFSKNFFNEKFHSESIDAEYVNFEIPSIKELPGVLLENHDLAGLNVTIPYKEQVIPYLDELDSDAAAIGAVNVIKIIRPAKGKIKLVGYNSDIMGFTQSIEPLLEPQHKKALILGTGGASKAIYHGLKKLGMEARFVSRTPREGMFTYEDLTPAVMDEYKVIINCTPVGMYPRANEYPNIPYECLTPNHLLYDLLYNPDTTLFMKKGADKGAITKNGLEMLLLQAFGAWDIWNK
jgi:shikimate dehydrogenase